MHAGFYTPLYKGQSFLEMMFRDGYQTTYTQSDYRMVQIQALLLQMNEIEQVFKYVAPLPAICYIGGEFFTDWIENYISSYKQDTKYNKMK